MPCGPCGSPKSRLTTSFFMVFSTVGVSAVCASTVMLVMEFAAAFASSTSPCTSSMTDCRPKSLNCLPVIFMAEPCCSTTIRESSSRLPTWGSSSIVLSGIYFPSSADTRLSRFVTAKDISFTFNVRVSNAVFILFSSICIAPSDCVTNARRLSVSLESDLFVRD